MKRSNKKPMAILEALTNRITREASECQKIVGLIVSVLTETMLKNE